MYMKPWHIINYKLGAGGLMHGNFRIMHGKPWHMINNYTLDARWINAWEALEHD